MVTYALADREPPIVVTNGATVHQRASRLPNWLRFLTFLLLGAFLRTTLWETAVSIIGPELGAITREGTAFEYVCAIVGCRALLLYFIWRANYDCKMLRFERYDELRRLY
jgi:hypothetical protein